MPVRLRDGRLLGLECKVSNGPKNSWKRLNREVGGKAERWKGEFGSQRVVGRRGCWPACSTWSCLESAQREQGVYLFWQHDLASLYEYLEAVTSN